MTVSRALGRGASGGGASGSAGRASEGGSRLIGRGVFAALVVATIAAFFISQHLKVTTPFISGLAGPVPPAINPVGGPTSCRDPSTGRDVSERSTTVSFYILHRVDDVDVYVVNQSGTTVRTVASDVFMRKPKAPTAQGFRAVTRYFAWDGRTVSGRPVSPGTYYFRVYLIHQQRTIEIEQPVAVETARRCVWKG